mmetsp:Transcript_26372/g.61531  ORF Transcript_26372/g.61531 Transcript_26372/m.61531 type:complete len:239 (+) Transcript_26372:1020-1736(+)
MDLHHRLEPVLLLLRLAVAPHLFLQRLHHFFDRTHVLQPQLIPDDLQITHGIDRVLHMRGHLAVSRLLKGAHHMEDGVDCCDMREEGVAEPRPFGRPLDQPGNVEARQVGGYDALGHDLLVKLQEIRVRNLNARLSRVDRAEREVLCRDRHLAHYVECCRLADVRHANDASLYIVRRPPKQRALGWLLFLFRSHFRTTRLPNYALPPLGCHLLRADRAAALACRDRRIECAYGDRRRP